MREEMYGRWSTVLALTFKHSNSPNGKYKHLHAEFLINRMATRMRVHVRVHSQCMCESNIAGAREDNSKVQLQYSS